MRCEVCGEATKVICGFKDVDIIIRERKCVECGHIFYTQEIDMPYLQGRRTLNKLRNEYYGEYHKKKGNKEEGDK